MGTRVRKFPRLITAFAGARGKRSSVRRIQHAPSIRSGVTSAAAMYSYCVICLAMISSPNSTAQPATYLVPSLPMSVIATMPVAAFNTLVSQQGPQTMLARSRAAAIAFQSHQDSAVVHEAMTDLWTETPNSFSRIQVSRPKRR